MVIGEGPFFVFYKFCEFHVQKCIVSKPELLIIIWESVCVPVIRKYLNVKILAIYGQGRAEPLENVPSTSRRWTSFPQR